LCFTECRHTFQLCVFHIYVKRWHSHTKYLICNTLCFLGIEVSSCKCWSIFMKQFGYTCALCSTTVSVRRLGLEKMVVMTAELGTRKNVWQEECLMSEEHTSEQTWWPQIINRWPYFKSRLTCCLQGQLQTCIFQTSYLHYTYCTSISLHVCRSCLINNI
jgi:hypothetical protein